MNNRMIAFKASDWNGYNASVFLKSLNDTKLSHSDLVVRESLQNSFDARANEKIPVDFRMKGFYLNSQQKTFFENILPSDEVARRLVAELKVHDTYCLEIRDKNSKGLNGPYQEYDEYSGKEIESDENNYRDFVWNMGGSKDRTKGGSFGVGKTALFLISKVKAVCIYSRTEYNGRYQSRFIIKCFYPYTFSDEKIVQYWFSKQRANAQSPNNHLPLPFLDEEADYIAQNIGIEIFTGTETGTSSLILDVDFSTEENVNVDARDHYVTQFPKIIQKWFWTKLSKSIPLDKQINISLWDDEHELELLNSDDFDSQYCGFHRCLEIWRDEYKKIYKLSEKEKIAYDGHNHFKQVILSKPKVMLGAVTFVKMRKTPALIEEFFDNDSNLCLARMRDVEFCMQYQTFKFPKIENDKVVFAMFHTDPCSWDGGLQDKYIGAVDAAFRKSENKTHEEWIPESVTGRDNTYVKKRIVEDKRSIGSPFWSKRLSYIYR